MQTVKTLEANVHVLKEKVERWDQRATLVELVAGFLQQGVEIPWH
jgi:hypothetical protein